MCFRVFSCDFLCFLVFFCVSVFACWCNFVCAFCCIEDAPTLAECLDYAVERALVACVRGRGMVNVVESFAQECYGMTASGCCVTRRHPTDKCVELLSVTRRCFSQELLRVQCTAACLATSPSLIVICTSCKRIISCKRGFLRAHYVCLVFSGLFTGVMISCEGYVCMFQAHRGRLCLPLSI